MRSEEELERAKSTERRALTAQIVYEALRSEGASELIRPSSALAWSGFAAGISMGLSLMAEGLLLTYLPEAPWHPLVTSFGYTAGFIAVTLGRQQLFTETTVTACLPLLNDPRATTVIQVLRFWSIVLVANLAGAFVFAWTAAQPSTFAPELQHAFAVIAEEAIRLDFWSALVRGIIGGWIIALMVWLMPAADVARLWIIILMTYLIAAADLTHVIAGSVDVFYGVLTTEAGWTAYLSYLAPVLLGNSIGGIVLVALLNHAQVVSGAAE